MFRFPESGFCSRRHQRHPGGCRDLVESYFCNHLAADVFIEALDDILALHGEFHAEGWIGEVDEECLVADVEGGGVGGNSLAHNDGPGVDEALLKEGRL